MEYVIFIFCQDILDAMEWHWLSCWQGILYGLPANADDVALLANSTKALTSALQKEAVGNKTVNPQLVQVSHLYQACPSSHY